jgi:hypothetical protein
MGRLVADAGKRDWDEPTPEYRAQLMEGLSIMSRQGLPKTSRASLRGHCRSHLAAPAEARTAGARP